MTKHRITARPTPAELSKLFEARPDCRVYKTLEAELDAVQSGAKAMAMELWPQSSIDDGDEEYEELIEEAFDRGLTVMQQADVGRTGVPHVSVYVLRPEQTWRVPAHRALWKIFVDAEGAWSDGAEALESHLLGYTDAQIAEWLAVKRHERLGWRGTTIYLLVSEEQKPSISALSNRSFDPEALSDGMTAISCGGDRVIRRKPPAWVARSKLSIARIAIDTEYFTALFGKHRPRGDVMSIRIAGGASHALNTALESKIQFLGTDGWH